MKRSMTGRQSTKSSQTVSDAAATGAETPVRTLLFPMINKVISHTCDRTILHS